MYHKGKGSEERVKQRECVPVADVISSTTAHLRTACSPQLARVQRARRIVVLPSAVGGAQRLGCDSETLTE